MMLWQNQIASAAKNLELGYNVQRPYPWRGTTPLTYIFFVGLTILLVFVNIPLSAYDIVQEFTYAPNDTLPSLPFTDFLPAYLRHTAGDFTPQTFKVGDTIQSNLSIFNYAIAEVYEEYNGYFTSQAVGSFPYHNNPLSSCDVSSISLSLRKEERVSLSAVISCWVPTNYKMTINLNHASLQDRKNGFLGAVPDLDGILTDLEYGWDSENVTFISDNGGGLAPTSDQIVTGLNLSVFPCCVCKLYPSDESYVDILNLDGPFLTLVDHPPCDNDVAKFESTGLAVYYGQGSFAGPTYIPYGRGDIILSQNPGLGVPSNVQLVLQNALQAIYHTIRLDLGVISPNQIFMSPSMFNESTSSVPLFKPLNHTVPPPFTVGFRGGIDVSYTVNNSYVNEIRRELWTQEADWLGPPDVRVPSVSYLRPVFRRKSTVSAISSVFVATFAMVSAVWSLFHFIAGFFCPSQSDVSCCSHCKHCRDPTTGDSESVLSRRSSRYEAIAMGEIPEHGP